MSVSDAAAKSGAAATAARKRKLGLRPSSKSGGPGKITVALRLAGKAKKRFKTTGKAKVRAKLAFAPSGQCAAVVFKSCRDGSEKATLKIKKKGKK